MDHHGVGAPLHRPARRKKSAKERRAQKARATARAFQHVAQALTDVGAHRGGKLRRIGTQWHAHISAPHASKVPMPRFLNLYDAVPSVQMAESARAVLVGVEPISAVRHSSAESSHITSSGTEELGALPTAPYDVLANINHDDLDILKSYSRSQLVDKIKNMRDADIWKRFCDEEPIVVTFGLEPDYDLVRSPVENLRYFLFISQHYKYYDIEVDKWYYGIYQLEVWEGRSPPFYPAGHENFFITLMYPLL